MLCGDLRDITRRLSVELMSAGLPTQCVVAVSNRILELEDLADRLELWERSAVPGPAARLDRAAMPANVAVLYPEDAA